MSSSSGSTTAAPAAAAGYFVDQKKGEVNELKQLLRNINVERDAKRKREIIKKVIAYMTLGIDVSRLLTEMVMAVETKDIVIKKMVYFFLCNYAQRQPEMAILCMNTLLRDCENEDPMVRGLALRSLCSFRLLAILEYVGKPLQKSLLDPSGYVRKIAVMGVLKLNSLSHEFVESNGYLKQLYGMLDDQDASVVTNVLTVLNELLLSKGGIEISKLTIVSLLNRIGEFNEWGLNIILDLVSRYTPSSEEETFAIMNLLDPVLRTANSGAVLGTFKAFISLTNSNPELHHQIIARVKPPLLTLITGSNFEVQFTILKHLEYLLHRPYVASIFTDDYRYFFIKYSEPDYIKYLKVDMITMISNSKNSKDIVAELVECVTDADSELSKRAIIAMGEIGMSNESSTEEVIRTLLDLIDLDMPYVRAQAVICASKIIRIFPDFRQYMLAIIPKCLRRVKDNPEAKAYIIWMMGEYGDEIIEAPYFIEIIINKYEEEQSNHIKLSLLTASMKLFFKRPPEMQKALGKLLNYALNENNQDLHDKALLYYRLLTTNVDTASHLFQSRSKNISNDGISCFTENRDDNKYQQLFQEFNSLSIIYHIPSAQFLNEEFRLKLVNGPQIDDAFCHTINSLHIQTQPVLSPSSEDIDDHHHNQSLHHINNTTSSSSSSDNYNLLDFDHHSDKHELEEDEEIAVAIPMVQPILSLNQPSSTSITPDSFQQAWSTTPETFNNQILMNFKSFPSKGTAEIEQLFHSHHIINIASGSLPIGLKFFFYASGLYDYDKVEFFGQMILTNQDITLLIKSNQSISASKEFVDHIKLILCHYQ